MFVLLKWKLLVMRRSVYKWSVFFIVFIMIFLISESAPESLEASSSYSEHGKWFAPICEGATFAWSLTTTRLSRTWNLFLLDERKWNRGVRLCRRSSQLKIKLISNTRKGYYKNEFLLKRWKANFNLQFVYAALKCASQLRSWSVTLGNGAVWGTTQNGIAFPFPMSPKGKLAICGFSKILHTEWWKADLFSLNIAAAFTHSSNMPKRGI